MSSNSKSKTPTTIYIPDSDEDDEVETKSVCSSSSVKPEVMWTKRKKIPETPTVTPVKVKRARVEEEDGDEVVLDGFSASRAENRAIAARFMVDGFDNGSQEFDLSGGFETDQEASLDVKLFGDRKLSLAERFERLEQMPSPEFGTIPLECDEVDDWPVPEDTQEPVDHLIEVPKELFLEITKMVEEGIVKYGIMTEEEIDIFIKQFFKSGLRKYRRRYAG